MDIIRADFDWTSLLVIAVAGIFGLIKSQAKKKQEPPMPSMSEFPAEEPKKDEWFTDRVKEASEPIPSMNFTNDGNLPGDYYKQSEEIPVVVSLDEEESEVHRNFDIRQAIISSEILRRPEY